MLDSNFLAKRIPPRPLPPPQTTIQKAGLNYERKVVRALLNRGFDLEHNPWFEYWGGTCCPDIIVYELSRCRAMVVEVKLKATPLALEKLKQTYCPIVAEVTGLKAVPLVITKTVSGLGISDLCFTSSIYSAIESDSPVYVWSGKGPIT